MAFNVAYSFNNGAVTGTATDYTTLYNAIHADDYTQITLSGTIEGNIGYIGDEQNGLFDSCEYLESIDLSNLNTSNATSMNSMFYHCSSLASVNLSNLNTINVTDMSFLFTNCSSLTNLDLSSFDTINVTDMQEMFNGCYNLEHIYVSNSFIITQVIYSIHMFTFCPKLPNFDSEITDKTMAYIGGYLEKLPEYSIQLKHNGYNAFPKVAVDGTTIVDTNGVISATAQAPSIATTSTAGIVKPDGTTISVTADGTISASAQRPKVDSVDITEFTTTYKNNMANGDLVNVVEGVIE